MALILLTVIVSGCAAGRAFRRGEQQAAAGDWDTAVAYLRQAVQQAPNRPDYRIALERAMLNASREHVMGARDFEAKGQLDAALIEWRRASEYDPANRQAAAKVTELEQTIRERVEAARPRPPIEQFREQARQATAEPTLNPASREPLNVRFVNSSLRDILNFIANAAGINITFDPGFQDRAYTVQLEGVTLEQALQQILTANNVFYKVLNQRTIIVVPETPANRAKYDEQVIQTFFLSHADATEMAQLLTNITRIAGLAVQPVIIANRAANTITVRATAPMVAIIGQVVTGNDKPRAEVVIDVEILEVNRARAQRYGLNLSQYAIQGFFSPEAAPTTEKGETSTLPFNLNTISQGVSTADFYLAVPSAVVQFLETDSTTRLMAKPQLRGAEGTKLTLNLGEDIPVVSTTFVPLGGGGAGTSPLTSFSYRSVGVNVEMTPRVTYEGDILLELMVESSSLGPNVDVAGTSAPSFPSRKVATKLRLRDGESNLLAGLLREDERKAISGLPGLIHVPGLRALFGGNVNEIGQTDIVMLLTPRIIRTHELRQQDLNPIYIGSQGNLGLTGPPPLIAAPAEPEPAAAPAPGAPPPPPTPTVPPGSSPVPGTVVPPPAAPPGPAPGAQIMVTPPGAQFQVAGGPYTLPITVTGASRVSTVSITLMFNPQALRVRTVQEGSFMRQGGVNAAFVPKVDAAIGRIDIAITRPGDMVGASGTGLLGVVLFDAIAAGSSPFSLSGVATTPEGNSVPLTFVPATVVVR
jgi:general secretion pathway protein D